MRMEVEKTEVCPQKPPDMRMEVEKTEVCPQKPHKMRMEAKFGVGMWDFACGCGTWRAAR